MLWSKSSLLLLVVSLVINWASAEDTAKITDYFNILPSGGCIGNRLDWLNEYITDSKIFSQSLIQAMTAATGQTDATGEAGRDGVVARKLFTKYFGVRFQDSDGVQTPIDGYKEIWEVMNYVSGLVNDFTEYRYFQGPGNTQPYIGCQGKPAIQKMDWNAQAFEYNPDYDANDGNSRPLIPATVDGSPISINQVFDTPIDTPYFVVDRTFYFPSKSTADDDICDNEMGSTIPGVYEYQKEIEGKLLSFPATEPGIIICPEMFDAPVLGLVEIEWIDPTVEPPPSISEVGPKGSLTMFHEIVHMATVWTQARVVDHTYDVGQMLAMAVGLWIPEGYSEPSPWYPAYNAETYTLFVFSWWYYKNNWGQGATPGTFYDGYLVVALPDEPDKD